MSRPYLVIKIGGDLAGDSPQLDTLANELNALAEDYALVVVHGGGPQATALTQRLGLEPDIRGGRRVTTAPVLEVAKMVLGGQVNIDLTAAFNARGLAAVGISGAAGGTIQAVKRPPRVVSGGGPDPIDFGFVGDIQLVDPGLLSTLCAAGYLPVTNSLGADKAGQVYNINADIAATRIAAALQAHLVLTTGGVSGVLRDKDRPETRLATLTPEAARKAIADGVIQGGMIPKIEESLVVLGLGVKSILIIGKLTAGDLRQALKEPGSQGTVILPA